MHIRAIISLHWQKILLVEGDIPKKKTVPYHNFTHKMQLLLMMPLLTNRILFKYTELAPCFGCVCPLILSSTLSFLFTL